MDQVYFRFYAELNDFLPPTKQQAWFEHRLKEQGSVKDTIEALGVPHPEVDFILANGESVGFSYLVQPGDRISVYPRFTGLEIAAVSQVRPAPLPEPRFVLDLHLGKLATYLRLLGFDVWYQNDYDDDTLANLSSQAQRILLTRDRALLKRSIVTYGYWVRAKHPEPQVIEILQRFELWQQIAPFQRCLSCNGCLESVPKVAISDRLPPLTQQYYDEFSRCQSCDKIYWKGGHYERMQRFVNQILQLRDASTHDCNSEC